MQITRNMYKFSADKMFYISNSDIIFLIENIDLSSGDICVCGTFK